MNILYLLLALTVHPSSICHELKLTDPVGEGDTVRVTGMICEYRYEYSDGDYHIYLNDSGCGMITEIKPNTVAARQFAALRAKWSSQRTTQGKYWEPIRVTITGKRHYDYEHFKMPDRCDLQPDKNGYHVEINPILSISAK